MTDAREALCIDIVQGLEGSARRLFMAPTVKELGAGGSRRTERELGWNWVTIRPHLLDDIHAIVGGQSLADSQFRSQRV